ncbi:hypothetical protein M9H77_09946 [Catharanthus roseus]|uniref:Uncharacterized protein n=1 Tax=Catharanthus roseus TaxID=4058 RepID=A0ACC0C273_CATRO|nr:hypothetical protein M9H77_09946 [Catharanthus roseus]
MTVTISIFKFLQSTPDLNSNTLCQEKLTERESNPGSEMKEAEPEMAEEEGKMQQLRSKATELLLREEWKDSIEAYSNFISVVLNHIFKNHNQNPDPENLLKQQKSLCLAFSNRAEARFRLREYAAALKDCDEALKIESSHFKTLICKGKILFSLNRYGAALDCFRAANLDPQGTVNFETLNALLEKCKKFDFLSKTGSFDLSDWIMNGFREKIPELAEYIGAIEIKISEISGFGLFATKNVESGSVLLATKAIATERGILPQEEEDSGENAQLVMWKNFIDKVVESATKCSKTCSLINMLSTGGNEIDRQVPEVGFFRPEAEEEENNFLNQKVDVQKILSILDMNSLVEDSISAKVLGKYSGYYGVGLWLLPSFINHSCDPNVRRLHIGDHLIIHASRDIKAGEELTFAYFDVLQPFQNRKKQAENWGFICSCKRCRFEENLCHKQEMREVEMILGKGLDMGGAVYRLEEGMKRWMVRGKGKGYLRSSFWGAYSEAYQSEKVMRRWGRKIPSMGIIVDIIVDAIGSDERVVKVLVESLKRNGGLNIGCGMLEMEKVMKFGRGIYGKTMKKQALRTLLQL